MRDRKRDGDTGLVELVPGSLYRVGAAVPRDGRLSWSVEEPGVYEPANCYLCLDDKQSVLIDGGLACHANILQGQISRIMQPDDPLTVFLTRVEPDTVTGVGAILNAFNVSTIYAGGAANPFDYFDDLYSTEMVRANYNATLHRKFPGEALQLADGRHLRVYSTPLRLLATFWAYDTATRTLFTSDSFGHMALPSQHSTPVVTSEDIGASPEVVKEHLLMKFDYLHGAQTRPISDGLEELFDSVVIERIAPTHGCILEGATVVRQHYKALQAVLEEVGDK